VIFGKAENHPLPHLLKTCETVSLRARRSNLLSKNMFLRTLVKKNKYYFLGRFFSQKDKWNMDNLGDSVWSAAVLLFFLMDPLGNIPVLLSILKGIDTKRKRVIIARELFIALGILLIFLFAGKPLLNFLHLEQEAVTISGGIILLIIGLRLIFPQKHGPMGQTPDGEPFLVPIAIPMIAGPSVLAMLILMTQSQPGNMTNWFFALIIA